MESSSKKAPRNKLPALMLLVLALVILVFVIWKLDSSPATNDAYASADTIDVVPEVSGRIVELAVSDNQQVKQGRKKSKARHGLAISSQRDRSASGHCRAA